jgi:hypothetical protein
MHSSRIPLQKWSYIYKTPGYSAAGIAQSFKFARKPKLVLQNMQGGCGLHSQCKIQQTNLLWKD